MLRPHVVPRLFWGALSGLLLVGCGPVRSTSLIVDAQAELAAARAANAEQHAPFEYVAAEAYLHKAREEQSYSDFEFSIDYASKSLDCARVARMRAERAAAASLGGTRPTRATAQKCLPGPARPDLPPADEEPAAGGSALSPTAPAKAAKKDPKEPDDPPPAPPPPAEPPPPQNLIEEPVELPDGDAPLPDGDAPDGDAPAEDGAGDGA